MVDLTRGDLIANKIDDIKKSVRRAHFSDSKEKEIIESLKKASWSVLKDEEFYKRRKQYKEKEEKIKGMLSKILIALGVFVVGMLIESECINLLPPWILTVTIWCFGIVFVLMVLFDIYYKGEFY